jgi:Ca-activated chloride channel family protein
MAENSRRRAVLVVLVLLLIVLLLLLSRCLPRKTAATPPQGTSAKPAPAAQGPAAAQPAEVPEILGAATLKSPEQVVAGGGFSVDWTGPNNEGDYITVVRAEAAAAASGDYRGTKQRASVELTAPVEPGAYEVRYVTGRSRTILARAPIKVVPAGATIDAAAEITLGSVFAVAWTGPNNTGDYITIVPKGAPDDVYGNYTNTSKGSPLNVTAMTEVGEAELRYVTGQGRKVLARRPVKIIAARVELSALASAVAGTTIDVSWTGPNNAGDYITVVPDGTPDGQYGQYSNTSQGSPLKLLIPIMEGSAELRYMTGQGNRVLGRRSITIAAAKITLEAPAECKAGAPVSIGWTGPNNPGDYITIVAKGTPDTQYGDYVNTSSGSPLSVKAPKDAGEAEIRYASGQGNKVLARIPIKVVR